MTGRGATRTGASLLVLIACAAGAQEGGVTLSFNVSQSLEARIDDGADPVWFANTDLGFALSSETRTQTLALTGSTGLRAILSEDGTETVPSDPRLRFSYDREGANSGLSVDLSLTRSDIAYIRPLQDFIVDGVFVPPEDFEDLEGEGTRLSRSLSVDLVLVREGPIGASVSFDASDLTYQDTTAPDLVDSQRARLGVDLRFKLSDTMDATLGLGHEIVETEGAEARETTDYRLGLSVAEPRGELTFAVFGAETDAGSRYGVEAGRSIDLPRGSLDVSVGATRAVSGATELTGSIDYVHELPLGAITLSAARGVTTTDDGERLRTSLSAAYNRPINSLFDFGVDASYFASADTATDVQSDTASLGLRLGYALSEDWSLDTVYRVSRSDETGASARTDQSLSISLGRSFDYRF